MVARWDGDTRGQGIGDGQAFLPGVESLLDVMARPRWISEDPELHVLPHLQAACGAPNSPWTIASAELRESIYEVQLIWSRSGGRLRNLRADIFLLIGAVAESVTHVRQHVLEDRAVFDVTTGTLDTDSPFQGHGHLLRLEVRRET